MARCWVGLIARIEWRSECKAVERPLAVLVGNERREVEEERHWVEGPLEAGAPLETVWVVVDGQGRRYRLRHRATGETRVEIDVVSAPAG
ncbi:MAG TPA: hypothetical protein P5234_05910 [Thermoanaerobaculaceae bacterium]|nr:hypothetical protein [Thermoanaerobaculaceae bacterium]HRS15771.1 hypothetical protein [Thermoanaerobaculaceae bacterium]